MMAPSWVRALVVLGWFGAAPLLSAQDEEREGRTPEDLARICIKLEDAVAAQPADRGSLERLQGLYAQAGVKPLLAESSPGAGSFKRLADLALDGSPVQCYREGEDGDLFLVVFSDAHYRGFFRTEKKTLVAKVSGFGPLRSLGRLESSDPKAVLQAAEKRLPDLRLLEETGLAIRRAAGTDGEAETLTRAAERLSGALRADPGRIGLLEELAFVYDRLGEVTLGSPREPDYRRLEIAAVAKLASALPDASTTHRSLALIYFRLGAYPLAAQEAAEGKDDPLAQDLGQVLRIWSQAEHERLEPFEVDGGYRVDAYRTKAAPPESSELFAELTYVVRRANRPEFAVYTLSSQKLKSERHYYIYFCYLGQRTLLTTYADKRPQDTSVHQKIATLIHRLADGEKKEK